VNRAQAPVLSSLEVIADVWLLRLEAPEIALAAAPGQFVMVRCGGDTVLPRPFSVHRVSEDSLSLLFAAVGTGTRRLAEMRRGDTVDIFGPLGHGFTVPGNARNLLLVAGGLGIAPLVFLAETAACEGRKVTIIQGARSRQNLMPVSFAQSSHEKGIEPGAVHIVNVTEDGTEGLRGLATDFVGAYAEEAHAVYACGPLAMYRSLATACEPTGLPVQVSLEIVMGCGTGVCYGCTIRTSHGLKQVCRDGPVFGLKDVDLDSLGGGL
jgi:dihydroorotate dehydrogenase electron transfer subunit